jgi:hypothetical protein
MTDDQQRPVPGVRPDQPEVRVEYPRSYPVRVRRRGGCLKTAIIVGITFLVTIVLLAGVAAYFLVRDPDRLLGFFRRVTPRYYPLAIAVADGETVHVLYNSGSLVPEVVRTGNRFDLAWRSEAAHATLAQGRWTRREAIEPFTGAVLFNDTLWILDDGGYRTWSDGGWSDTVAMPDWISPRGCVAGDTLWIFYEDADRMLRATTTNDGTQWTPGGLQQQLPAPPTGDEHARFLETLHARYRVAVLDERPYVFWYDPDAGRVRFRFHDGSWSQPHSCRGSMLFAVAATGAVLYFFDVPAWRKDEEYGYDEATVTMRTFDGRHWTKPDELEIETTLCLDASRVGDDVWLFTSGYRSLYYTVYSKGDWGRTTKVPAPKPARGKPVKEEEPRSLE